MPQKLILIGGQRLIMAIGGALRAAIKAGNWASAARESRRRARALAQLNASGGIRGSREMASPESRGFVSEFGQGTAFGPRGNVVLQNDLTGARRVPDSLSGYGGTLGNRRYYDYNPIEAPYEGFRVLPPGSRRQISMSGELPIDTRPGPWQGRGSGTSWQETPVNGFDAADGSVFYGWEAGGPPYFHQFSTVAPGFGGPLPTPRNFDPARGMIPIPFEEVMRARGSLMGDPRFGPYVPF